MSSNIKLLQINTNRSRPAMNMALAMGNEIGASAILVSEPNQIMIRNRKDWIKDVEVDSAIKILDHNIAVKNMGHGTGYTYIEIAEFTIYSCYFSGNKEITELESSLDEIGRRIRLNKEFAIIAGDFNAKSPQWGMDYTDNRGQIVTNWMAENGFIIGNVGSKPTFQRRGYTSILDLTVFSENMSSRIRHWEVSEKESLSDHNYIISEVARQNTPREIHHNKIDTGGWIIKKLDNLKLEREIALIEQNDISTTADGFSAVLKTICDKSMPQKRSQVRKQPVYWWNENIASLRRECIKSRRTYTRIARRNDDAERDRKWDVYQNRRKSMRDAIRAAKRSCWEKLRSNIDKDIWGNGYKIAMKGILGFPPRLALTMNFTEDVAKSLFPSHPPVTFSCSQGSQLEPFTLEELEKASRKLKNNKAPGPGKIPSEILKKLAASKPDYVLEVYNRLARERKFPENWKKAKLVLLRKGDKSIGNPSSYRPLSLLDVEGKLYEQLLLLRLKQAIKDTGDLSTNQYGFREGRQTVDAIKSVVTIATRAQDFAHSNRKLCAMVTVDVKNAFNSASWQIILDELRKRRIDESIIAIISSYLSDRKIIMEAEGHVKEMSVNSGVPQGSVLGPTLWNILYDELLEIVQPENTKLIAFADDVAIVATAKNEQILTRKVNSSLSRVTRWMENRRLQTVPEKTEALIITTKRKIEPIVFNMYGSMVTPTSAIKYLGVWLDSKLKYDTHIDNVIKKAEKSLSALTSLMPNVGGPRSSKRKVLASVIHSQLLYAAPVWYNALNRKCIKRKFTSIQRGILIRVISSYRTISAEAAGVISGVPPLDLMAQERQQKYNGINGKEARERLETIWQTRWTNGVHGRWTHKLIPNIKNWINRPHGEVDYFLTQALSGHGCFREFLYKRRRAETNNCQYCGDTDDVEHTLFNCTKWTNERETYNTLTGEIFSIDSLSRTLIAKEDIWIAAYQTIRHIIENKEKDLRDMR